MGLNYERGLPEAIHSFGHRTEATMARTYGYWEENHTRHNWEKFALVKAQSPDYSYSGCGTIHYPPNGVTGYDYSNPDGTLTNCDDFWNYPNLSDPLLVTQPVTCTTWDCTELGYLSYWYSHLPAVADCDTEVVANNWWLYFSNPNLALYPSLYCPPPPCPTITNWLGEYWTNTSFIGPPRLCRNDAEVNFDWGGGSPDPSIIADKFSARWTRTINFSEGVYRFSMMNDDGAHLYIDDTLKIDAWGICCTWSHADVPLSAGDHRIRMEMFENDGGATAKLLWQYIGPLSTSTPTPTATSTPTNTATHTPTLTPTSTPAVTTLVLQPDATAGVDTYIYSGSKNSNFGSNAVMGIGEDNNANNRFARSLLKFDLSSVPANATINSAVLSLWTDTDLSSNDRTIRVYRLKVPFNETQATWNIAANGTSWQTGGASGINDRENTAIGATTILNNEALNLEKQIVLTPSKIQEMVGGSFVNRGFILVADSEQNDRFNYKTSDATSVSQRPKLVIQYTVSSVPPSATPTATNTPMNTPTQTNTPTPTNTSAATNTPTATPTRTNTPVGTNTPTPTSTPTSTPTPTSTFTSTPTPTSAVSDVIFADGFESGSFSAWSANSNNGGNLSVSTSAALVSSYGMQATFANTTPMFVRDDTPAAETRYRARFYFHPNSITMAAGDTITVLQGLDAGGQVILAVQFNRSSKSYQLRAQAYSSTLADHVNTSYFPITNAVHVIEVDWGNDGHLTFWIDGVQKANLTGINNSLYSVETLRLGAPTMTITGTSGSFYIDAFESRRQTYIGP
jgi:hypothetical protein